MLKDIVVFLPFIVFVSIASVFSCYFKKQIETTFPLTALTIILTLFVSGLLNNLLIGLWFIWIFSIFCFTYIFKLLVTDTARIIKWVLRPGLVVMMITMVVVYFWHYHDVVDNADELVQWALAVKNSYITNRFSCCPSFKGGFFDYPPAVELFHYFWLKTAGNFKDSYLFISMNVLIISFLISALQNFSFKSKKDLIIASLSLVTVPYVFYFWIYTNLSVDGLMGIVFGWLLYLYFIRRNRLDFFTIGSLSLGLFILLLIKSATSIIFAVIVLILITTDLVILVRKNHDKTLFIKLTPLFFFAFLSKWLWKKVLALNSVPPSWVFNMDTVHYIQTSLQPWQKQAFINFYKSIFNYRTLSNTSQIEYVLGPFKVSLIVWLMILLVLLIIISRLYKSRSKIFFILLYVGGVLYIPINSLFYLVLFGEGEDGILSSFSRYINTYLIGILLFCLSLAITRLAKSKKSEKRLIIFMLIFFLIVSWPPINYTPLALFNPVYRKKKERLYLKKLKYRKFVDRVVQHLPRDALLYAFYSSYEFRYYIMPVKIASLTWQNFTFFEFEKTAKQKGYTHVFLEGYIDSVETDIFKKQFKRLFTPDSEIKNRGLYKVLWYNDTPRLKYLTQIDNN